MVDKVDFGIVKILLLNGGKKLTSYDIAKEAMGKEASHFELRKHSSHLKYRCDRLSDSGILLTDKTNNHVNYCANPDKCTLGKEGLTITMMKNKKKHKVFVSIQNFILIQESPDKISVFTLE